MRRKSCAGFGVKSKEQTVKSNDEIGEVVWRDQWNEEMKAKNWNWNRENREKRKKRKSEIKWKARIK